MLRRSSLAFGGICLVYLAAFASFIVESEANENRKKKDSVKYKLTNVLTALAPETNVPAILNRTRPDYGESTKKKDVLENAMSQLGPGQVRSFADQSGSTGQVTEVSEPPREYDFSAQRRMEEPGSPRVINLPGMINVFGPPPKRGSARPPQDPLHILELPGLKGRSPHENYEVVPPHFNSENIPVHFYPNVQPPEVTGGKPRHIFMPFPKRYERPFHAEGLHGGYHQGLHGGFHSVFHEGISDEATDDDRGPVDGYGIAGLSPFHHEDISEFSRLPPESGVPLADQIDDSTRHVNIDGNEMGRFLTMPAPSITSHPPKHVFEPGKEFTLDNGREIDMNNEMHVVEHGHHDHHHHFHDRIVGDEPYPHYDDRDEHGEGPVITDHPDDVDAYESHGAPVSVADPEHVVHEHHNVEHHHHWVKARCYPNPCRNAGTCTALEHGYQCTCSIGYKGSHCEEVNQCQPNPCKNGGDCYETGDGFQCTCNRGYKGEYCESKLDIC